MGVVKLAKKADAAVTTYATTDGYEARKQGLAWGLYAPGGARMRTVSNLDKARTAIAKHRAEQAPPTTPAT